MHALHYNTFFVYFGWFIECVVRETKKNDFTKLGFTYNFQHFELHLYKYHTGICTRGEYDLNSIFGLI